MDVDKTSKAYRFGKALARLLWFGLGYVVGRQHKKKITDFPLK